MWSIGLTERGGGQWSVVGRPYHVKWIDKISLTFV